MSDELAAKVSQNGLYLIDDAGLLINEEVQEPLEERLENGEENAQKMLEERDEPEVVQAEDVEDKAEAEGENDNDTDRPEVELTGTNADQLEAVQDKKVIQDKTEGTQSSL